jgi:hypothetical protein
MADSAGLDLTAPLLSADGLHSGKTGEQQLASSECLLTETVVADANKITPQTVKEFCAATSGPKATRFETVFTPPQGQHASTMDEALIHLVVWDKGKWTGTWYQYERSSKPGRGILVPLGHVNAVASPPDHLLGKGGLGFLAIHLNIDDSCGITYDVKATHIRPLNQQDVVDLISLAESYATKGKGASKGGPNLPSTAVGIWGGQLLISGAVAPATIVFSPATKTGLNVRAGATKDGVWGVDNTCKPAPKPEEGKPAAKGSTSSSSKRSSPLSEIETVEGSSLSHQAEVVPASLHISDADEQSQAPAQPSANGGSPDQAGGNAPQDGSNPGKSSTSNILNGGALTVPDEGFYWWDVSVAMPVTSFNQLKYDSVNNLLIVKNTNDIKPYALFDIYFGPQDLRLKNAVSKPMFAFGIPMSGRPLQKPFVGLGFTVAIKSFRIQPLVGLRVEKDTVSALAAGSPATPAMLANSLHSEWHAKLQVMIGFSVGDAAKVLGIKK